LPVSGGGFAFLVPLGAARTKVLVAFHTVHGRIFDVTEVTLDHPVDISFVLLG